MAYIRKFKTTSGATGVQVCYKDGERVVKTVHVGSGKTKKEIARLMQKAQEIVAGGTKPLFNLSKYDQK